MASLPSQHPTLSLHLSDVTLTPLITSSSSQSHLESLTSLTTSALNSQTTARRANLGRPQRIMVEYPDHGAVVFHSYLDPRESSATSISTSSGSFPDAHGGAAPSSSASSSRRGHFRHNSHGDELSSRSSVTNDDGKTNEIGRPVSRASRRALLKDCNNIDEDDCNSRVEDLAPLLVGVVVAGSSEEAREARRAVARLERFGRDFQREWMAENSGRNNLDRHR